MLSIIESAATHRERVAVIDDDGPHTYDELLSASARIASRILERVDPRSGMDEGTGPKAEALLGGAPVAYLVPPEFGHVAVQWGIWRAGGMAVPLALSHPRRELEYVLDDASPVLVVAHPEVSARVEEPARARGIPLIGTDELLKGTGGGDAEEPDEGGEEGGEEAEEGGDDPWIGGRLKSKDPEDPTEGPPADNPALMIYTSGTTGRPKGVVHTHRSLDAQSESLIEAWGWTEDDHILLVLPLHHVHGIVNVLLCALRSGAACTLHPRFDAARTWACLADGSLSVFMAVPTIYHRLIAEWESRAPGERERLTRGASALRLMVSGSAALPETVLARWKELTGHTLLERYGMSETGMILSNPLHGERRPGHVGGPVPGMAVRLVDESGRILARGVSPTEADRSSDDPGGGDGAGGAGEVQVRGSALFREYFRKPEATERAFTDDGWFRTGDVAVLNRGSYKLLGRSSVDILKTGGFKVSALEVESVLLEHPAVSECAVIGVPDAEWGERVCAFVVCTGGAEAEASLEIDAVREWAKERMAPYKSPSLVRVVEELPRNALGKVQKPRLLEIFEEIEAQGA